MDLCINDTNCDDNDPKKEWEFPKLIRGNETERIAYHKNRKIAQEKAREDAIQQQESRERWKSLIKKEKDDKDEKDMKLSLRSWDLPVGNLDEEPEIESVSIPKYNQKVNLIGWIQSPDTIYFDAKDDTTGKKYNKYLMFMFELINRIEIKHYKTNKYLVTMFVNGGGVFEFITIDLPETCDKTFFDKSSADGSMEDCLEGFLRNIDKDPYEYERIQEGDIYSVYILGPDENEEPIKYTQYRKV